MEAYLTGGIKMTCNYEIIRSDRKTISLEITREAKLIIRAPRRCPVSYIQSFAESKSNWIDTHMEKQRLRAESRVPLSEEAVAALTLKARMEIPPLVERYAALMGLKPAGVKITKAERRFGSCSAKNRLCFSFRLMGYPKEAVEYVVVHELAHIVHRNHGKEFYALIESVLPDYKERDRLLKK
ncbi:MAG: M48 family metallopeptidase [Oscillospiraceae bacterium]|nr:M48 family metallopeptidase [Oscillospiraceae bacterium]